MSFYSELKDFLSLHKRERRGLMVLAIILFISMFSLWAIPRFCAPDFSEDKEKILLAIKEFEEQNEKIASLLENQEEEKEKPVRKTNTRTTENSLFPFDPNQTSKEDWLKLGLNAGQVKTINTYLAKGGKFYKPNDLSKIYTISDRQFETLKPYISIKSQAKEQKKGKSFSNNQSFEDDVKKENTFIKNPEPLWVDINAADTSALKRLKGIGSFYAKKIVELRKELGGFHSKNQLLEIWKFDQEKLQGISEQIHLGEKPILQIRINHCEAKQLAEHPYISWKEANALISYRDQHGFYTQIDQITKSHLISEELCQKIKPYLRID